jgi:hypothetical protein
VREFPDDAAALNSLATALRKVGLLDEALLLGISSSLSGSTEALAFVA